VKLPIIVALILLSTTGCANLSGMIGGEQNDNDIGRWTAYARAVEAESRAKTAYFDAKRAEYEAIGSSPTSRVEFTDSGGNQVIVETSVNGAILAAKQNNNAYGIDLSTPVVLPKSAIAEVLGVAVDMAKVVVQSPFAVGVAVGATANAVSDNGQDGVRGEHVTINGSYNDTSSSGDGTIYTGGDQSIPVIGEGDAEPPVETGESVYGPAPMGY
jgi:hypothetical protein